MNDAVLQVLLILAYLAIGLISVTFPIYAISVNFLPQQKWEGEKERKKRMDGLRGKISQLTGELKGEGQDTKRVTELEDQIEKYKNELESSELRYQYLTARGAVGIPVIALVVALISACFGIYGFYSDAEVTFPAAISVGCSTFSIYRLYKTISAVEYGALRPERTVEFNVGFGRHNEKRMSIECGKTTSVKLFVDTLESEVENVYVSASFPSELAALGKSSDPDIVISVYEDVTVVCCTGEYIPKGRNIGFSLSLTPKKKGEYSVEVLVSAKGIYEYQETLTIEVV